MTSILVIDDSRTIRETLSIVLGQDYHVSTAASAAEPAASADPALLILGLSPKDDAATRALLIKRATVPVLFLHASDDLDPTLPGLTERRIAFLRKPFGGLGLRAAVGAILAPTAPTNTGIGSRVFRLEFPFLTREAATTVRQSLSLNLPILFVGEPGTGALGIARAVHGRSRPAGRFRALPARDVSAPDLGTLLAEPNGGVFLEAVSDLSPASQQALLVELAAGPSPSRLFGATTASLDAAVARGAFVSDLAYPLGVLTVSLPPLRDRTDDLPSVIEMLSGRLADRLGLAPVAFGEAAVDRLCHYLWFGNMTELEAVLARTMVACASPVVGADDIRFLPESASKTSAVPAPSPPRAAAAPAQVPGAPRLEVLLGELAHELRNPMVTLKTFSQHLDAVLEDPDVRARFTTLTQEAVERMDTLLEQLLEFARFRMPARAAIDLGPLLDEALAEQHDELVRRGIRLERNGATPGAVDADRAQITFALRTLLSGLVRDLKPHEPLTMTVPESGAIELEAHAEPAAATRLTAFVEGADAETDESPTLSFALAAALLERNGGSLRVRSGDEGATVVRIALVPVAT